ncbi:defensin-like protein 182 [Beta vulgaris subsp. vulgaris]|uniref:defensin-like protein 182 n=1 Tax=Beta vulgaris subsp. vulgaris TaxID=3555 RepID=UPI0025471A28|nr:defensin-like protein 182 [Beta vulgaris subsp. vulgaris]
MAQQFLHKLMLLFVLTSLLSGYVMDKVSGEICVIGLGECGKDCEERCTQMHQGNQSHGECDYSLKPPLCSCYYDCTPPSPPPPPPPAKKCHENDGICSQESCDDECCMAKCKNKFYGESEVLGICQEIVGASYRLCLCEYDC